jgi:hypothetical protein
MLVGRIPGRLQWLDEWAWRALIRNGLPLSLRRCSLVSL